MNFEDLREDFLATMDDFDHHEVVRKATLAGGLTAYIAVHNTNLGPALGGLRMYPYANERDAIVDVLRLSRGMTYKNAMANLPLGGGKAVIIGNPFTQKTPELMRDMGKLVESLEGKYITAEDSGSGEADMEIIAEHTSYVVGLPPEKVKGDGLGGNPSPLTALGVYRGIQSAVKFKLGRDKLAGLTASVQGVGAVGLATAKLLKQDGMKLIICDVNAAHLKQAQDELGDVTIVSPDEIYGVAADVFVPSAMGGVLNDKTILQLKVSIVSGASNNQLFAPYHDKMIADKNILYVPDYVVNAGGVICVGYEYFRKSGYNPQEFEMTRESMVCHVEGVGKNVMDALMYAKDKKMNTGEAADRLAEERFMRAPLPFSNSIIPPSHGQGGGKKQVH